MIVRCLLCHAENVEVSERISVSELAGLYEKMLGESVWEEFDGLKEINFYQCRDCDLRFFYPVITGSEAFYEKLQRFDWYYLQEKDEYDFAARFIAEGDKVLEIGCGRGAFARKVKTRNYIGLEFSSKAKLMGEKEGINIVNETVQDHALVNRQVYDVVCSFQVLEHVSDANSFLKSSIECLKPGGVYIVSVPSADSFISLTVNNILNTPPHHITWWTDKSLHSISDIFGIELVKLEHEKLADIHRGWYASTVTLNAINAVLKRSPKLIDISISGRIISKFVWILGQFYVLGIIGTKMRPHGHSVNVVYRKGTNGHR